ncbi:4'-phosphopantetheinyl transferase family protein [Antarcticibacterium arcticum]|uniref:4'-phosphopantetheinyl transferase family protein n=1 Tax=Antarcticibacterium arcticum TaxID=2585771 RepID=UPI00143D463C|nr:4'-phosphopantetheinyl transferase superfamily protein [Antarcticibacterium arcticum]
MIGNDIVDLRLAAVESDPMRQRFLDKVFTKREQAVIFNASKPLKQLWLLWTMKEAAYKAHQRRFSLTRKFNPLVQQCVILSQSGDSASGEVKIGTRVYHITSIYNEKYIHSLASINPGATNFLWEILPSSADLRKDFLLDISQQYGIPAYSLAIEKDRNFVPVLMYKNKTFPIAFSFSKHGKFGAFSRELMNY